MVFIVGTSFWQQLGGAVEAGQTEGRLTNYDTTAISRRKEMRTLI